MTPELLPPGRGIVHVVAARHPLRHDVERLELEAGATLGEIVERAVDRRWWGVTRVYLGGEAIEPRLWDRVRPKPGAEVVCRPVPRGGGGGGKNPLRTILSIGLVVAAAAGAAALGPALGAAVGVGSAVGSAIVGSAISILGGVVINALAPPPTPRLPQLRGSDESSSPTYLLSGGRNALRPYYPVPLVVGRHRMIPPYAAQPFTEIVAGEQYLRLLFILGYGDLSVSDMRIGDTPLSSFDGVQTEIAPPGASTKLYPRAVSSLTVDAALDAGTWVQRTTPSDTTEIVIDVVFPGGLFRINDDGRTRGLGVSFAVEYREEGSETWTSRPTLSVGRSQRSTVLVADRWEVAAGRYEVRVRRTTPNHTDEREVSAARLSEIKSVQAAGPLAIDDRVTTVALRIKASGQLSGVVDTFNCIVSATIPHWDGSSWVAAETSNAASVCRYLLQGPHRREPLPDGRLKLAPWQAWAEFCHARGLTFDAVFETETTLREAVDAAAAAGRASIGLPNGAYEPIVDDLKPVVVQQFSPRNSWGFEATREFSPEVHGVRAQFVDASSDWQPSERTIYADGFGPENATRLADLETFGQTQPDAVHAAGRYYLAVGGLRPETYVLDVDVEHLVCTRGDRVRLQHDVILVGLGAGRILSMDVDGAGDVTRLTLDERLTFGDGEQYGAIIASAADNAETVLAIDNQAEETATLRLMTAIPADSAPAVGDLVFVGVRGAETLDCVVSKIDPRAELQARLTLVDYAPAIFDAAWAPIPDYDPRLTAPSRLEPPGLPTVVSVEAGGTALVVVGDRLEPRILIRLGPGAGGLVNEYRARWRLSGTDDGWRYEASAAESIALTEVEEGQTYDVAVQAVGPGGVSGWRSVSVFVDGESSPPPDVSGFEVNVVGSEAHVSWDRVQVADLSHYWLRFSPNVQSATWNSGFDVIERISRDATAASVPARVGSYMLKAVDLRGNESEVAAVAATTISRVQGLNFAAVAEEQTPDWSGTGDGACYCPTYGGVTLEYEGEEVTTTEGTYTPGASVVDLGSRFQARLTAELELSSVDLGSDLYALSNVYGSGDLYGGVEGDVSASYEIRTTDDDPSASPTWSAWRRLVVGEITARAFQYRLRLRTRNPSSAPIVTRSALVVDMVDRVVSFAASIAEGGGRVDFDPPFYVAPEIGIAVVDGEEGDRYTITNRSAEGFDIAFTNAGTGVAREITGVARAYGERA